MKLLPYLRILAPVLLGLAAALPAVCAPQESTSIKTTIAAAPAPEGGGPRNWQVAARLNLREQPSTEAKILTTYTPGTILDNLGCRLSGALAWCDVQQLGGGPRGFVSAGYLKPAISPNGSVMTGPDDSAIRAGQGDFDASGKIPCIQGHQQATQWCEFGVSRAGGGYATVVVTKPDGRPRAIFFRMNVAIGADTSQADGYPEFSAVRQNDTHIITIGNERYEIPDAVTLGG